MKFSLATLFFAAQATAFAPAFQPRASASVRGTAENLDLPCENECAIESYPNLPDSVHPGVLSGQAQMDLLQHAKENGKDTSVARADDNGICRSERPLPCGSIPSEMDYADYLSQQD